MKNVFLLLVSFALIASSCKKNDDFLTAELNYDGDNFSAPEIAAGTFDMGVRFTSQLTDGFIGQNLFAIDFYIQQVPAKCELMIYGEGTNNTPGTLLYSKDITSSLNGASWNSHLLDSPIEITGEDIWVSFRLIHSTLMGSIGCDAGPARNNGDWILGDGATDWVTYRDLTGNAVDVNWNIRGQVGE